MTPNVCLWDLYSGLHTTDCGHTIVLVESVGDTEYKFCPFCGREIVEEDLDDPE